MTGQRPDKITDKPALMSYDLKKVTINKMLVKSIQKHIPGIKLHYIPHDIRSNAKHTEAAKKTANNKIICLSTQSQ